MAQIKSGSKINMKLDIAIQTLENHFDKGLLNESSDNIKRESWETIKSYLSQAKETEKILEELVKNKTPMEILKLALQFKVQ